MGSDTEAGCSVEIETSAFRRTAAVWLPGGFSGYDIIRVTLGLMLMLAASLKMHQLATEPVSETSLITSRWVLVLLVEFELALGLSLVVGLFPRLIWLVAVCTFATFAAASFYEAVSGGASCGCFGKVSVSPWLTVVGDVVAVAVLWRWRPRESAIFSPTNYAHTTRAAGASLVFLTFGVPGGWAMATFAPNGLASDGSFLGNGSIVVLEPEKWIGRPFPLSKYIDIGDQLSRDHWTVVLYHHDCPKCQALIEEYESSPTYVLDESDLGLVALIEMPPFGSMAGSELFSLNPRLVRGKLTSNREWFVTAPVEIELNQGTVAAVSDGTNHRTVPTLGRR